MKKVLIVAIVSIFASMSGLAFADACTDMGSQAWSGNLTQGLGYGGLAFTQNFPSDELVEVSYYCQPGIIDTCPTETALEGKCENSADGKSATLTLTGNLGFGFTSTIIATYNKTNPTQLVVNMQNVPTDSGQGVNATGTYTPLSQSLHQQHQ